MCGISGIVDGHGSERHVRDLFRMLAVQHHRGPDACAYYWDGPLVLGHNRLTIIDTSAAGMQPMTNEDGSLWLVFNGEIYNFLDLRPDLEARGHRFRSRTDSEVLLHLYEERGPEMMRALNGIFAFAIYDRARGELFLARDQLGVKPLYYSTSGGRFAFASEIKALLAAGVGRTVPPESIEETLIFGTCAGERTLFRDVQRLLPGETMRVAIADRRATRQRYWLPPGHLPDAAAGDVERLHGLLTDAVRRQLIADVPVGTMCSGGIDSSLISAMASQVAHARFDTYVVQVDDPHLDETRYADLVGRHIGSHHHVVQNRIDDMDRYLRLCTWLHDEPLYHETSIAIFQISLRAKHEVTVLLSGEGADELFGGYRNQRMIRDIERLRTIIPAAIARTLEPWLWRSRSTRLARAMQRTGARSSAEAIAFGASRTSPELLRHLGFPVRHAWDYRCAVAEQCLRTSGDVVEAHIRYDQQTYLQTLLDRQDKMSMGASIEARVPFLDIPLFEAVNAMGMAVRHRDGEVKWALRQIGRQYLPAEIFSRPKHAFGLPLVRTLRSSVYLRALVQGLPTGKLVAAGAVPAAVATQVCALWERGHDAFGGLVWHLANLELWWELFVEGGSPGDLSILPSHATEALVKAPLRIGAPSS